MRVRTYLGILVALTVTLAAAFLTHLNIDLLRTPFRLGGAVEVPFWALLIGVFLLAFLPTATILLTQSVRRDLAVRQERRRAREVESLERARRRAIDLQADQQWTRAATEFETVLAAEPDDFDAQVRYGEVLRELERGDEAVEVHRKAAVQFPDSVALLHQLAVDYEVQGQPEVGREIRNRILRDFESLSLRVLRRRRNAALDGHDWAQAAALQERIEALVGGDPSGTKSEAQVRRGITYQQGVGYLEEDRFAEGAEIFRTLLEEEPRFIPAAIMLGEAERLGVEPRDGDGGAHDAAQERAVAIWREGFERTGSPIFLQRIEDYFIDRTEPAKAIETLWALIGRTGNDLLLRFFLGRLYYRLEMHDEALRALEEVRDGLSSSPTYHFLLARIHQRRGEAGQALKAYEACARHLGASQTDFHCRACRQAYSEWQDRCETCGAWNSVELDFKEEQISPEALGLALAPVWGGYDEPAEAATPAAEDSGAETSS